MTSRKKLMTTQVITLNKGNSAGEKEKHQRPHWSSTALPARAAWEWGLPAGTRMEVCSPPANHLLHSLGSALDALR